MIRLWKKIRRRRALKTFRRLLRENGYDDSLFTDEDMEAGIIKGSLFMASIGLTVKQAAAAICKAFEGLPERKNNEEQQEQ